MTVMKALKSKDKGKIIMVFADERMAFEPSDHELIDVDVTEIKMAYDLSHLKLDTLLALRKHYSRKLADQQLEIMTVGICDSRATKCEKLRKLVDGLDGLIDKAVGF